jgi:hypothetical protein
MHINRTHLGRDDKKKCNIDGCTESFWSKKLLTKHQQLVHNENSADPYETPEEGEDPGYTISQQKKRGSRQTDIFGTLLGITPSPLFEMDQSS